VNIARVFTLEEVRALIPQVEVLVGELLMRQADVELLLAELAEHRGTMTSTLRYERGDDEVVTALKGRLRREVQAWDRGWRHVESLGGVVRDHHAGLVDFYGYVNDRLVWLCWAYGEDTLRGCEDLGGTFIGQLRLNPGAATAWSN
jgi:hypothetical protein